MPAHILRTDAAAHGALPADTELAQAVAILARAQQDAVWDRTQAGNELTSHPARVLPRLPQRGRRTTRRRVPPHRPRPAGCRAHPRTRLPADEGPASVTAEEGRPQEHRRRGGGTAPHGSAASADAPTSPRRRGDGPEGSGTSAATRCRLCRCR
ncbi:IS110 family transposase [Streptomyces cynarae]|uniref:IS110 family transposase n=1 Tax=Streptomyces cynarae TaxID=2981134 RepID=A0ABY6E5G8_9ACTN|nr:IS110 family transposase [Streptomyces cynarae]UXY21910.1 IS110 family transposase [Streptomyces cynarae]